MLIERFRVSSRQIDKKTFFNKDKLLWNLKLILNCLFFKCIKEHDSSPSRLRHVSCSLERHVSKPVLCQQFNRWWWFVQMCARFMNVIIFCSSFDCVFWANTFRDTAECDKSKNNHCSFSVNVNVNVFTNNKMDSIWVRFFVRFSIEAVSKTTLVYFYFRASDLDQSSKKNRQLETLPIDDEDKQTSWLSSELTAICLCMEAPEARRGNRKVDGAAQTAKALQTKK